ncbi:MAG: hypothetical protein Q9213_006702 [Squamulea squamosa]
MHRTSKVELLGPSQEVVPTIQTANCNAGPDFQASLDQELLKARSFYQDQHQLVQQSVKHVYEQYRIDDLKGLDNACELLVMDLGAVLVELRDSMKRLLWYWIVNFDKTMTSLAKFQEQLAVSDADLALRTESIDMLRQVEVCLKIVQSKASGDTAKSVAEASLFQERPDTGPFQLPLAEALAEIQQDDAIGLDQRLNSNHVNARTDKYSHGHTLFELLHFSIVTGSQSCTRTLLSDIVSLRDPGNHIHQLIERTGRFIRLQNRRTDVQTLLNTTIPNINSIDILNRLADIISKLGVKFKKVFQIKDLFGRVPLHYAAQYNLSQVCQAILEYTRLNEDLSALDSASPALISDSDGVTPLELCVLHGNPEILQMLLDDHHDRMESGIGQRDFSRAKLLPGKLLTNAIKVGRLPVIQLLHRAGSDMAYTDHHGNTALHLAVRSRKLEYVTEILHHCNDDKTLELDSREIVYGWTPLILAAINGDQLIAELLLQAGADPMVQDNLGWRAKDHAAFRGWLPMARNLSQMTAEHTINDGKMDRLRPPRRHGVESALSANRMERHIQSTSADDYEIYKPVTAVDLSAYVWPDPYDTQRETDFLLEVRAVNEDLNRHLIRLPILEDQANKPWRFLTKNAEEFKLAFTIYHSATSAHTGDLPVGSAVALLRSLKQGLGPARESLIRNFTVPILQRETLDFIGTVTFYFLIVTPFPHPDPTKAVQRELSFSGSNGLPIIGHKGMARTTPVVDNCSLERILSSHSYQPRLQEHRT